MLTGIALLMGPNALGSVEQAGHGSYLPEIWEGLHSCVEEKIMTQDTLRSRVVQYRLNDEFKDMNFVDEPAPPAPPQVAPAKEENPRTPAQPAPAPRIRDASEPPPKRPRAEPLSLAALAPELHDDWDDFFTRHVGGGPYGHGPASGSYITPMYDAVEDLVRQWGYIVPETVDAAYLVPAMRFYANEVLPEALAEVVLAMTTVRAARVGAVDRDTPLLTPELAARLAQSWGHALEGLADECVSVAEALAAIDLFPAETPGLEERRAERSARRTRRGPTR